MFRKMVNQYGFLLVCTLIFTVAGSLMYFGFIAYSAWRDPAELHPPILPGWTTQALQVKKEMLQAARPEMAAILADETKSGLNKLTEIGDIQLAIASFDTPPRMSLSDALKFTGHYAIDTSLVGGVWKVLMLFVFFFFMVFEEAQAFSKEHPA